LLSVYEKDCLSTLGDLIGVEEELGIKVPGLPVPVIGRLDMLVETPKALVVIDTKTSKGTFTAEKLVQATAQLALYGSALDPLSRQFGKPIAGRVIVFRKLKHAKIETIELNPTSTDLRRVQLMLSETWGLIEAAHRSDSFPARPSWMCRMCPFQGRCSQETGMSA
jgi:RecB family exonuclease